MDVTKTDRTGFPGRDSPVISEAKANPESNIASTSDDGVVVTISPEALKNARIDISVSPKGSKEGFLSIKKVLSTLNWLKRLLSGNISNN